MALQRLFTTHYCAYMRKCANKQLYNANMHKKIKTTKKSQPIWLRFFVCIDKRINYLTSASAPASVSFLTISSADSLGRASLIVAGALSTRFLASTRPRPVSSRTALITAILLPPIAFKTTSNSVFSSSTGAAAAAPPATAIGAAALTPNSSSIA